MIEKARRRRTALARRAQYIRDVGLTRAPSKQARDRLAAELSAIRWALRVIDAAPDLADSLAHWPEGQTTHEEDQ
jgi:hypothetical protein